MKPINILGIVGIAVTVNQILGNGSLTERLFALAVFFISIILLTDNFTKEVKSAL
jgi:hypothetical protein